MSVLSKITSKLRRITAKQAVVAGVFTLAIAGAASFGFVQRQLTEAGAVRDCSPNSINYASVNGGCGAATPSEYVNDLKSNKEKQKDVQKIAANFNGEQKLTSSQYDNFAKNAKRCWAYKSDNTVKCDGKTVLTSAWSIGRHNYNNSDTHKISGAGTYYKGSFSKRFGKNTDKLEVFVLFNEKGEYQYGVISACGNPVGGKKVAVTAECKLMDSKEVGLNKYEFTTTPNVKNATVEKVVYYQDGKKIGESNKSSDKYKFTHTVTKSGKVTAEVYVKVPGGKTIKVVSPNCEKPVTYKAPFYACDLLRATARDEEMLSFRFTVEASAGNGAELDDADFSIWIKGDDANKTTVTGVTQQDEDGNIYHEAEFPADGKTRVIEATVNFNLAKDVKSVTCQAEVTPKEEPKCPVKGKEDLPADSPECYEPCPIPGKEHIPADKVEECVEPEEPVTPEAELPKTGAGSVIGIFAATTGAGAALHRLYMRRKN
jgi:hypothetical protein